MPPRRAVAAMVLAALLAGRAAPVCLAVEQRARGEDTSLFLEADREAEKLLDAARAAAQAGDWRRAVEAYQRVADFAGRAGTQPLVPAAADPTIYVPIQQAAALELARLPAPALELYREAHNASSKALFDRALAARDAAGLAAVAQRYLASSWGDDALAALGAIAFERGDHVGALAAWDRLLEAHEKPSLPIASLRARMWVCRAALGQSRTAEALARDIRARHGGESLRLAGKAVAVSDFLAQHVAEAPQQPLADWPALGGDASHARVVAGPAEIGGLAWRFFAPAAAAGPRPRSRGGAPSPLPHIATVSGERVFLTDDGSVCALDIESGRPVWLHPDAPEAGPAPLLDETLHAASCSEGRVFARLGAAVVALDAATGRLLWRRTFAEARPEPKAEEKPPPEPAEKDAPPAKKKGKGKGEKSLGSKATLLLTPPVAAGPRVLVGITHLGEEARARLVALDAATGQELWRTFVCSRSLPTFLGLGAAPSPPAVSGSTAYFSTNLGAAAAVDVATGAIRWVQRYASFGTHLRQSLVERRRRWASGPPIVSGGLVFVAPQDNSDLLALDAVGGAVAWSAPREGGRHVVGVEGRRLFVVGQGVQALDRHTGKRLWSVELPAEAVGRPALCDGRLYVPTEDALLAIGTGDAALRVARHWQPGEAVGNVTAVEGAVLVAGSGRLCALNDWAATQRALAARRKEDPDDPLVPLTLGLHEAHVGRSAAAIPHLEEALRLAGGRKDRGTADRARQALYEAHRALGEAGDAAAWAKAVGYASGPHDKAAALLALAHLHEQQGRSIEAVAIYQRMLEESGGARCHLEDGLAVSAQALATAEVSRLIREHGRGAYAATEAEAARALAAARTAPELEGIVRRFPNSAAAEQALLQLVSSTDAKPLVPHLTALAGSLALDAASDARAKTEARLRELGRAAPGTQAVLTPRWQVQARIGQRKAQAVELPGAPKGHIYFATARRVFDRALPFDGIECRRADTGQLVWARELSDWDTLAAAAGGHLVIATFDRLVALDPLTGVERWTCSPSEAREEEPGEPEELEPPRRPIDRERPWRLLERRRAEQFRIVALAASQRALFVSLSGGQVVALALADGQKLWSRQLDARVMLTRGLFLGGDKVWACAESPAALYGLNEADGAGNAAVSFKRDEDAFALRRITDRPAYVAAQHRLYVVVDDRAVHALDLATGRTLWDAQFDFSIRGLLASEDGQTCYVVPAGFAHDAQILALDGRTGTVRRRRSLLAGALTDAALAPGALYVAQRDNDNALSIQALDPNDLGERWRTAPMALTQPSRIAHGEGLVAVAGRHGGQRMAVLCDAASGRILGDFTPKGAAELFLAIAGEPAAPPGQPLLVLGTDWGIHALGTSDPQALDQQIAALSHRLDGGDRAALPALAGALYQRGDEKRAIALLARALADEALPAADYAALKDQLNALRESLATREPPALDTQWMPTPPDIDGLVDEPWPVDSAAKLDGPAHIDEVQGVPPAEARWRSPSDLSAVLYTGWDSRYFYFAVDVTDDVHRTYTGQSETWVGDGLIISVDCEDDGGYGYRFTSKDLLLTLALTRKDERRDDDEGEEPSGEYRVRLKDDNSGAVYEIAIPWEYMGIEDPRPGLRFGFNVTVTDDDSDRAVKAVSWSPGMILDRDRTLMIRGFAPAYFGKVTLRGPQGGPPPLREPAQWAPPTSPRDDQMRIHRIHPSKEK